MDGNLTQRRRGLEEKIPDIRKTLSMVEHLRDRRVRHWVWAAYHRLSPPLPPSLFFLLARARLFIDPTTFVCDAPFPSRRKGKIGQRRIRAQAMMMTTTPLMT